MSGLPSLSEKLEKFLTLLVAVFHQASVFPFFLCISVSFVDPFRSYKHCFFFLIGSDLMMTNLRH